jgi:hypothetical protein
MERILCEIRLHLFGGRSYNPTLQSSPLIAVSKDPSYEIRQNRVAFGPAAVATPRVPKYL